jgi:hypothetical protein
MAWREYLGAGEMEARLAVIRQRKHTGPPLRTAEFIQRLEETTQRWLTLQKRGPHETIVINRRQVNSRSTLSNLCFTKYQSRLTTKSQVLAQGRFGMHDGPTGS